MAAAIGKRKLVILGCCLGMVIGSVAPWAEGLGGLVSVSGLDGDGWFPLIAGIVAAVVILRFRPGSSKKGLIAALVIALIATLAVGYDVLSGSDAFEVTGGLVSLSWGIYLSLVASLAVTALLLVELVTAGRPADAGSVELGAGPDSSAG